MKDMVTSRSISRVILTNRIRSSRNIVLGALPPQDITTMVRLTTEQFSINSIEVSEGWFGNLVQ